MSYIKSCYVYAKFDEPIKVAQWKLEKLWSFKKARNVLIKKIYILLDFAQYLRFQEVVKNSKKLLMFRSDLRKKEVCIKWYKNALSEQVFGKWMHFEIILSLWELQIIRDWLC